MWSRLDGRPLPRRATQGPGPNYPLTITNLEYADTARYVCQVTNAYGNVREYATLTVERELHGSYCIHNTVLQFGL